MESPRLERKNEIKNVRNLFLIRKTKKRNNRYHN